MWLGIFMGGVLTVMMMMWRVRGAIIIGGTLFSSNSFTIMAMLTIISRSTVLVVSIISWPRQSAVTSFPYTDTGNSNFDYCEPFRTYFATALDWIRPYALPLQSRRWSRSLASQRLVPS